MTVCEVRLHRIKGTPMRTRSQCMNGRSTASSTVVQCDRTTSWELWQDECHPAPYFGRDLLNHAASKKHSPGATMLVVFVDTVSGCPLGHPQCWAPALRQRELCTLSDPWPRRSPSCRRPSNSCMPAARWSMSASADALFNIVSPSCFSSRASRCFFNFSSKSSIAAASSSLLYLLFEMLPPVSKPFGTILLGLWRLRFLGLLRMLELLRDALVVVVLLGQRHQMFKQQARVLEPVACFVVCAPFHIALGPCRPATPLWSPNTIAHTPFETMYFPMDLAIMCIALKTICPLHALHIAALA